MVTPGRLSGAIIRLLMRQATVVASDALGDRYRLITVEGAELGNVVWVPGQKIQIAMGSAFNARTYTPLEWNAQAGRTCFLGYAHGDGPGSDWVRNVRPGDACDVLGPRRSLDVRDWGGPLAIFGDETSIGLAYALTWQDRSRRVSCHLEAGDVTAAERVAMELGIAANTRFHARRTNDDQIADMEESLAPLAAANANFVLTGRAGTIQRLRQQLRRLDVPVSRILAKAYWAPGKKGLD